MLKQSLPNRRLCVAALAGVLLAAGNLSHAASTAIINAKIHLGAADAQPITGSIVFSDGLITQVSEQTLSADTVIDAKGKSVTPGLIGSLNQLGLLEVNAVAESNDSSTEETDLAFQPGLVFNPESSAIPLARLGGVTRNLITPSASESAFAGVASTVDLSGQLALAEPNPSAAVIYLWGDQESSRAKRLGDIQAALQERIDKAQQKQAAKDEDKTKEEEPESPPTLAEQRLDQLLDGELPLLAFCDRPADILALLKLKQTFGLELIIAGGDGAVAVKQPLAAAKVPVILDPWNDLPKSFDSLHASLTNAAKLHQAGVSIAFAVLSDSTHGLYQLRFGAGIAIANGLPPEVALAAISSTPAGLFDIPAGRLEPGLAADLVLWENDPFDYSGKAVSVWIDGKQQPLETRADRLRQRYTQPSKLPAAYVK